MTYLASYRKWRPIVFENILGQEAIVQTLKNALLKNCVNHAYLFSGSRGTGKTTTARILAKAINCLKLKNGEPCNVCINCIKFNKNIFMDLLEIDAASNRGIEEIRDLREKLKFHPVEGKSKVYIIDEVHMLTTEAFNALLKTLEDPPANVFFILATTESHKIPLTILSRCQHFYFRKISNNLIEMHLKKIAENTNSQITKDALVLISKLSEGSLRDAINLLDQCISFSSGDIIVAENVYNISGITNNEIILSLIEFIGNKKLNEIIDLFVLLKKEGKNIKQLIKELIENFKNILLIKIEKNFSVVASDKIILFYQNISKCFELNEIFKWIYIFSDFESKLHFSTNPYALLEIILIKEFNLEKQIIKENSFDKKNIEKKEKEFNLEKNIKNKNKIKINNKEENINKKIVKKINICKNGEELWNIFLKQLKKEKPLSYPFYVEGKYGLFDTVNNLINIFYDKKHAFHKERAEQEKHKSFAEQSLSKIFGKKLKLNLDYKIFEEKEKNNNVEKNIKNIFGENVNFLKNKF